MNLEISHGKVLASDYIDALPGNYHRNRVGLAKRMLENTELNGIHAYDFGCGEGVFMRWLSAQGAHAVGCDPTKSLIDLAPEGATLGGVEAMEREPDASFDLVVALNVLFFLTEDELARFWQTTGRILKAGGYLLHTNPNIISEPRRRRGGKSPAAVLDTMRENGLHEVDRRYFGYQPRFFRWPALYRLTRWHAIAPKIGLRPRSGRVYHPWRLAMVPRSWQVKRSVGYYSLARKAQS